jgi:hypothetical protein
MRDKRALDEKAPKRKDAPLSTFHGKGSHDYPEDENSRRKV